MGDGKNLISVNCWEVVCERWIGISDRLVSSLVSFFEFLFVCSD